MTEISAGRSAAPLDEASFAEQVEPLRGELRAHCYGMLGSVDDADDALQDALLRAWRGRSSFAARGSLRSWLYTVATRCCLDAIERRGRRWLPLDLTAASDRVVASDAPRDDVLWLGPFPSADPASRYEQREAVELAFVAALQHLSGNQRAALLLFDVVGLSAAEVAQAMGTTVAAANSALERARRTVATRVPAPEQLDRVRRDGDPELARVVARFCAVMERGDLGGLVAMLAEDVTWSMPPLPHWYRGRTLVAKFAAQLPLGSCGEWRALTVEANGGSASALYLRPPGAPRFEPWSINVLTLDGDQVQAISSFLGAHHFPTFGLPPSIGDA